jgi:predicted phosphodiesterase
MDRARSQRAGAALLAVGCLLAGFTACDSRHTWSDDTWQVQPADSRIHLAVIGDYGRSGEASAAVARLVQARDPDFVITTGDNNYPHGEAKTIDRNIGALYARFIHPYRGIYGSGAERNRFFPTLGNHDLQTDDARPYLEYFTLPGDERHYDFRAGSAHFFALESDARSYDGLWSGSRQRRWLAARLAGSPDTCWRLAYFHHPPYASTGKEVTGMRWPFAKWGIDVVLSGHAHVYERLQVDGVTYFVVGNSGNTLDPFDEAAPEAGSLVRFNDDFGALFIEIDGDALDAQFVTRAGRTIDQVRLTKPCVKVATPR